MSDENDFEAVSERQSIESDAERIENNRALYVLIEPTSLPSRGLVQTFPSIVEYAIKDYKSLSVPSCTHDHLQVKHDLIGIVGKVFFTKCSPRGISGLGWSESLIQRVLDPDGDGFACYWDPEAF